MFLRQRRLKKKKKTGNNIFPLVSGKMYTKYLTMFRQFSLYSSSGHAGAI